MSRHHPAFIFRVILCLLLSSGYILAVPLGSDDDTGATASANSSTAVSTRSVLLFKKSPKDEHGEGPPSRPPQGSRRPDSVSDDNYVRFLPSLPVPTNGAQSRRVGPVRRVTFAAVRIRHVPSRRNPPGPLRRMVAFMRRCLPANQHPEVEVWRGDLDDDDEEPSSSLDRHPTHHRLSFPQTQEEEPSTSVSEHSIPDDDSIPYDDEEPSTSASRHPNHHRIRIPQIREPVLYFINDEDSLPTPDPDPPTTRMLPPPQPTSYSPEGLPEFEWWYTLPNRGNDAQRLPGDVHKPFQLIPKAGGCYKPLDGAIGSSLRIAGDHVKAEGVGHVPMVFGFPGAPGSGWYFSPLPEGTALQSNPGGASGASGQASSSSQALAVTVANLAREIDAATVGSSGNTIAWDLMNALFDFIRPLSHGTDCRFMSVGQYIATYTPHLVEMLLQLFRAHLDKASSKGPPSKRSADGNLSELRGRMCDREPSSDAVLETGLYINCAPSAEDPSESSLESASMMLGNWSLSAVCDVFPRALQNPGPMPTIDIDCGLGEKDDAPSPSEGPSDVYLCINNHFNLPCTSVVAPLGQCVAVPSSYINNVTSLRPSVAAGDCSFYTEPGCQGGKFASRHPGIDLYQVGHLSSFNDKVRSFQCGLTHEPSVGTSGMKHWEWSKKTQKKLCSHFDQLSLGFQLGDSGGDGTYDTLKLQFIGETAAMHTIAQGPSAGFHEWHRIDLKRIFNVDKIDINRIRLVRIAERATSANYGGDGWRFQGMKFRARCATSGIMVEHNKFASINKDLQIHNSYGGSVWTDRDYSAWEGFVNVEDWVATPPCSHFKALDAVIRMSDKYWSGTSNDLYIKIGQGRFQLAHEPERNEVSPLSVDVKKAFNTDKVAFNDLKSVTIESQGGHDQALPSEIQLKAICDSQQEMAVRYEQSIQVWIPDGGSWTHEITAQDWKRI